MLELDSWTGGGVGTGGGAEVEMDLVFSVRFGEQEDGPDGLTKLLSGLRRS